MSKRGLVLTAVVLVSCATLQAGAPAPAGAAPAALPPDLQVLLQKTLALQPTSERFSVSLSAVAPPRVKGPLGGFSKIFGRASSVTEALFTAAGEVSFVPQRASFRISFLGFKMNARVIDSTLYIEEPMIARLDGGRPWVEQHNEKLSKAFEVGPSAPGGAGSNASEYAGLIATLNAARSVQEVGPAVANGRPVTVFKATLELTRLATLTARQKHTLRKLIRPLAVIELFIADDGLPLRTRLVLHVRHHQGELITQSDILAVNVPVVVEAPPADKTISDAQLTQLLKRRAMSELRRAKHKHRGAARTPSRQK